MFVGQDVLHQVFKLMVRVDGGVHGAAHVGVDGLGLAGDAQIQHESFFVGGGHGNHAQRQAKGQKQGYDFLHGLVPPY